MNLALLTMGALALGGTYWGFKKKDPSIKLGSCFFERLIVPLYTGFNHWYSNGGLLVDYIGKDYIEINTPLKKLYGIKIVGTQTIHDYLSDFKIDEIVTQFKRENDAFFYYVLHKDKKWQRQYILSYNKSLLKSIASYFNSELMIGVELVNVVYDTYLSNSYYIENNNIKRALDISSQSSDLEPPHMAFKRLARQALYSSLYNVDVYQSYKNLTIEKSNILELFRLNFTGSIWFYFDISKSAVQKNISKLILDGKVAGDKEPFTQLQKKYDNNEAELVVANATMYLKDYEKEVIGQIGSCLKTNFLLKELGRSEHIKKTPLKHRDVDFDFVADIGYLKNFIASVHKKNTTAPDFFGVDKGKAFINFSFSRENDNPHSVIIGTTGSGKSITKQKIISQMIGLDFKTGLAQNLGKGKGQVRLRSYDIGFSDDRLINLIKSNPNNSVAHISSTFSDFGYNLVSLSGDKIKDAETYEADKQFAIFLASLILESQGGKGLNIDEKSCFDEALDYIYSTKDYQNYRITEIEYSHPALYEELLEKGYKRTDPLQSIEGSKYDFLKKPLLIDVAKYASLQSHNKQRKEAEREAYMGLYSKLNSIDGLKIFSGFDRLSIEDVDVIAMDLNNFKESKLFAPIFFAIFQKTYLKDREYALKCKKENKPIPKLLYCIEEARNFFRASSDELLGEMFEKLALEARKYGVHLQLLAQNPDHIPLSILKNIDSRIFLFRPDKKLEIIKSVDEVFGLPKNVKEAMYNTEQYEMCVWYAAGVFNLRLEISPEEMKVFTTNPNDISEDKQGA